MKPEPVATLPLLELPSRPDIIFLEKVKATVGLVFLLGDIFLVGTCCVLHFLLGVLESSTLHGAITLDLFCTAGIATNLLHFFRHERNHMAKRNFSKKVLHYLLLLVPCSSLVWWSVRRCTQPDSIAIRRWTATLRLCYCTGSFMQAVLQIHVMVQLWWERSTPDVYLKVTVAAAVVFTLHAIVGVSGYIWTLDDGAHTTLPAIYYILVLVAFSLNMGTVVFAAAFLCRSFIFSR